MLARNSLISIAGSVVPVLVTIVTMPHMLSVIGVERYGSLALCWLIMIYVGQADWGLGRAVTHRVARLTLTSSEGVSSTIVSALVSSVIVGTVMGALAGGVSWLFFARFFEVDEALRTELLDSVWLIGLATLASSLMQVMYGALAGKERFASASTATMVANASLPVLCLMTALWNGADIPSLMLATLTGRLLGLIIAGADLWLSQLSKEAAQFSLHEARELFKFGFWIMTASFTAPLLVTIDRLIVGTNLGAAAVAAYTIPYQIVSRLQLIPQSLMNVLFPRISVAEGGAARSAIFNYTIVISAMFLPIVIGLICILQPLLEFWLGSNLDERSAPVGMVLLCAFLLAAIGQALATFMQAQNDGKFVAAFQLSEIPPYVILLGYAAYEFGLLGVAFSFLLRRIVEAVGFSARARMGFWNFWIRQLPAMIGIAIAVVIEPSLGGFVERFLIGSVLAIVAFVAAIFAAPQELRQVFVIRIRSRLRV